MDSGSSSSICSDMNNDKLNLSDDGSINERPLQWHGDHWDELLDYESTYIETWDGEDWMYTHLHLGERSIPNEQLYTNPYTQSWLQKLANLSRGDFPTLKSAPGRYHPAKIPLFRDEDTGDEYQIVLNLSDNLIYVSCPMDSVLFSERVEPLSGIVYQEESPESTKGDVELPRFVISPGPLAVRSNSHAKDSQTSSNRRTELTEEQAVIDAENETMPICLLCSRGTLRERHQAFAGATLSFPSLKD